MAASSAGASPVSVIVVPSALAESSPSIESSVSSSGALFTGAFGLTFTGFGFGGAGGAAAFPERIDFAAALRPTRVLPSRSTSNSYAIVGAPGAELLAN